MRGKGFVIQNAKIYGEDHCFDCGYIVVEGGRICEIGPSTNECSFEQYQIIEPGKDAIVIPGMIDLHIHGANGADMMDSGKTSLDRIAGVLPKEGVTGFLATSITQSQEAIEAALINAGEYIRVHQTNDRAEILGIHLEGPFINAEKAGAQPKEYMRNPDVELFKRWQSLSQNTIKIVTLAPELPFGKELIMYLSNHGVIPSVGHSNATLSDMEEAIDAGLSHVTHLYNQMRGLHHREPGVVGAALLRNELSAEIIVDGIHVHPEMVKLAYRLKGSKKLMLVTDAMRAKCLKNGYYDLGGQEVKVDDGKAVLRDGTLAGSVLKMNNALKNLMNFTDCTISEAIEMASGNVAKQLKIFHKKGSLAPKKDADIVILNGELDVMMTFCKGRLVYQREG